MMTTRWCPLTVAAIALVLIGSSTAALGANTNLATNPLGGSAGSSQPLCYSHWQSVGPFHVTQSYPNVGSGLKDPEDIGAVNEIWLTGTDTAYVGAVNGGVWKTTSLHSTATFGGPHWTPLTDQMDCNSIASVSGSSSDGNVVAAGCGFPSNSANRGGEPRGVMLTKDGGTTWSMTNFPKGYAVTSLLVSGTGSSINILVAAKAPPSGYISGSTGSYVDPYGVGSSTGGIWLSTDAGATFTQSPLSTWTYPVGKLLRDPTTSTTIYALAFATFSEGSFGPSAFKSTDSGATWNPLANRPTIVDKCTTATAIAGVAIAVASSRIYLGYFTTGGSNCYAMYYSSDITGSSWTAIGNIPDIGGQGASNFAILANPGDSNTLFVSGTGSRVWRVDTTAGTWTDIADAGTVSGTTASGTAPHADARNLAWDAAASKLIRCDDGSCYIRSSPLAAAGTGDWTTLSGDLSITEGYQAAYDSATGAVVIGAQDNSVMISQLDGTEQTTGKWSFLLTGDGGSVAVDDSTSPSSFYGCNQNLAGWFKVAIGSGAGQSDINNVVSSFSGNMGTCQPGTGTCFDFVTMTAANRFAPSNVLVCTLDSLCYNATFPATATAFEFKATDFGLSGPPTALVFGGVKNGINNPNVILGVSQTFIWSRDVNTCTTSACITAYTTSPCTNSGSCLPGSIVNKSPPWKTGVTNFRQVAQHPTDYYINAIIDDAGHVWLTVDFGQTWQDIALPANSNLLSTSGHTTVDTMGTMAAIFVNKQVNGVYPLIVGTTYGSFVTFTTPVASGNYTFVKLGANQPKTFVSSYSYSVANDVLVMQAFGRGIWTLQKVGDILALAAAGKDTTTINSGCTVPLYPNIANAYGYISSGVLPSPIGFPGTSSSSSTGAAASSSSSSSAAAGSSSSSSSAAATSSSTSDSGAASAASSSSTAAATNSTSGDTSSASGAASSSSSSSTGSGSTGSGLTGTITSLSTGSTNVNGTSSSSTGGEGLSPASTNSPIYTNLSIFISVLALIIFNQV